jgi:hypothetical protein
MTKTEIQRTKASKLLLELKLKPKLSLKQKSNQKQKQRECDGSWRGNARPPDHRRPHCSTPTEMMEWLLLLLHAWYNEERL